MLKFYYQIKNPVIECYAYEDTMLFAIGCAECDPMDMWNEDFGKQLAKSRAVQNYYKAKETKLLIESQLGERKHKNFNTAEDMLFDYGYVLDDKGINLIAKILDNAKLAKRIKHE
jgi:hypothetical protein